MNLLKRKTIYQIALRTITPDGTLNSAKKMLPHIASLGFDIVYLNACFVTDDDTDISTWSERQSNSGSGNPKNPYKMADYFHVDEEYGTDKDLYEFIETAHQCGLEVLLDLVYLHCGKNAVFIKEHPDFVRRNEDGTILAGEQWPFARLNYDNKDLREYLYGNMVYLIKEYNADGFRCDVGDMLPLDFWKEGTKRIREIKPNAYMLNEGESSDFIAEVFDGSYHWSKQIKLIKMYENYINMNDYIKFYQEEKFYKKTLNYIENHDEASDSGTDRFEKIYGTDGVESMLFLIFTVLGVPFLWNGQEVSDTSENCMFSNRFFGMGRNYIDWSNALTDKGKHRMETIKRFSYLYHSYEALYDGNINFINTEGSGSLLCFIRQTDKERLFVCINTGNSYAELEFNENAKVILSKGINIDNGRIAAEPYGYILAEIG